MMILGVRQNRSLCLQGLQRVADTTASGLKAARFVRIPQATPWIPHDQPQKFN
jgi:hypothetical protein